MANSNKNEFPPKVIYLQIEDEWGNIADNAWDSEVYWCDEQIYDSDIKYVRVDDEADQEE